MKKLATFVAATSVLFGAQVANAATYTPAGTYVFSGSVNVKKDLGTYPCTLTVTAVATATSATATGALSGGFPCALIQVNGTGTVSYNAATSPPRLTITGFTIVPPLSSGTCTGSITTEWRDVDQGVANPTITLSTPLSNSSATSGAPCTMVGVLSQTSPASPKLDID